MDERESAEMLEMNGAFKDSLLRNNKKIRADRAESIIEDAETIYKRKVEDLKLSIKRKIRDQENMLDLSPDTAMSLKVASDFNAEEYVNKDAELSLSIRNEGIKLELAVTRYKHLFGKDI